MMRKMVGVVVKKSTDKTVKVRVDRMVIHPKYKKRYRVRAHYLAHDPNNACEVGQQVTIQQCRPMSKLKTWRILYSAS